MTIKLKPCGAVCIGSTIRELAESLRTATTERKAATWRIGDLLNFAEQAHGEKWAQLLDEREHGLHWLQNVRWVCSSIPLSRRRESLSFSHHEVVAAMEPKDQDRWLDRAEKERLSCQAMRDAVIEKRKKLMPLVEPYLAQAFKNWTEHVAMEVALLKKIRRGEVEVVDFRNGVPVVRQKKEAA